MREGNLRRREGGGHHFRLLFTDVGEFSVELTLDYSQTILLSLTMSYDGDDESRRHEERTKLQILVAGLGVYTGHGTRQLTNATAAPANKCTRRKWNLS